MYKKIQVYKEIGYILLKPIETWKKPFARNFTFVNYLPYQILWSSSSWIYGTIQYYSVLAKYYRLWYTVYKSCGLIGLNYMIIPLLCGSIFFNNIFQGQVFGDNLRNKVTGEQNNQMTLPEFVHLFVRL